MLEQKTREQAEGRMSLGSMVLPHLGLGAPRGGESDENDCECGGRDEYGA